MNDNKSTVMNNAAVQQLRKVPGFDPMKLLRKTISVKTGHPVWKLDLRYKRLWFRLACPNGRMLLKPLRISDQLAIIEAQVYFSKDDPVPAASFASEQRRENIPGGEFLRAAQEDALNMALENAGFGIQFCDVSRDYGGELFGSEVPIQTEVEEAAVEETKALIAEETAAETAPPMDMDSAPTEQHVAETTASDVQNVTDGFTSVAVDVRQEQSVSAAQEEVRFTASAGRSRGRSCRTAAGRVLYGRYGCQRDHAAYDGGRSQGRCGADRHLPRLDARTGRAAPSGEPQVVSLWLRSGGQHSQSRCICSAGQSAAESRMKRQVWMKGCGCYQSRFFAVSVPHYRHCSAAAAQYPQARPGLSVCGLPALRRSSRQALSENVTGRMAL